MAVRKYSALLIVALAAGAGLYGWYAWRHAHEPANPSELLARLPTQDAVVLGIDFRALRRGGVVELLGGSKTPEEAEYQAFVRSSGFDYKRDLDSALVSFAPEGTFFFVRGNFDWKKLEAYAQQQGGSCFNRLCRLTGSTPARRISFLPVSEQLMALAVSTDDLAATRLLSNAQKNGPPWPVAVPPDPVWVSIPAAALKRGNTLPAQTQLFASAIGDAERITLTVGPRGQTYEARLEALCRSQQEAALLTAQLQKVTAMLREVIARNKQKPPPNDLTAVLTAGVFEQSDKKVLGRWALQKSFLENLAGGI